MVGAVLFLAACAPNDGAIVSSLEIDAPATPVIETALDKACSAPGPSISTHQSAEAGSLEITLVVSPGTAGENDISLFFFDREDELAVFERVQIFLTYLQHDAGVRSYDASVAHPGHAVLIGRQLSHSGRWRLEARFHKDDSTESCISFNVAMR